MYKFPSTLYIIDSIMEEKKSDISNTSNSDPQKASNCVNSKYQTRKKYIDFAKIGEKLSLTGSNCHFCKSIMTVGDSNACRYTFSKHTSLSTKQSKKRTCNKKFCFDCLKKHFPLYWETRFSKEWQCPCCSGDCLCIQCKKNSQREKLDSESPVFNGDNLSLNSDNKLYDNTLYTSNKPGNTEKEINWLLGKFEFGRGLVSVLYLNKYIFLLRISLY